MQAKIKIEGMHCGSCAIDIKETLEERAGIEKAEVSYDDKTAVIEFDGQIIQTPTIIQTVEELGYKASVTNQ